MMCLKIVSILLFSVITVVNLEPLVKNVNNYGPFYLSIDYFATCAGPKSKNLTTVFVDLDKEHLLVTINFTFLVEAKVEEIKLQVFNLKDNKKTFLWNHKLTEPCKHFSFAAIIKQSLKATNCVVKMGSYFSVISLRDLIGSFFGGSFFYGTYFYKSEILSKKGNIACFVNTITINKKIN